MTILRGRHSYRSTSVAALGLVMVVVLELLVAWWPDAAPLGLPLTDLQLATPLGSADLRALSAVLLALGVAPKLWRRWSGADRARPSAPTLLLAALAGLTLLGVPGAANPAGAAQRGLALLGMLGLVLALESCQALRRLTLGLLGLVALVQAGVGAAQFLLQRSLGLLALGELTLLDVGQPTVSVVLDPTGQRWLRAYGLTVHPNVFGGLLAALLALLTAWALIGRGRLRWALLPALAPLVVAIAWSFSRGAWVGAACGLAWLLATGPDRSALRRRALVAASLLACFLLALAPFGSLLVGRLDAAANPLEGRSLAERQIEYRVAWQLLAEHATLGVGAEGFAAAASASHPELLPEVPLQPLHNTPLLVAVETGLLAGVCWLALMAQPLRGLRRKTALDTTEIGAAAGLAALFGASLFDHYLWDRSMAQTLLALLLGLWSGARDSQRAQTVESPP
jgi:O-antigen ligase